MGQQIMYSFIIPHRNTPCLLDRLLKSIPQRDDIEIIIIDDNSDDSLKPVCRRCDTQIIYINKENTKGAGHARNCGIEIARGKWLLFADSDDYYVEGFLQVLDEYSNAGIDVLYYSFLRADSETGLRIEDKSDVGLYIKNFTNTKESVDLIKFKNHMPWSKMVRHDFVSNGNFHFEEVLNGNDILFSYFVGYNARKIEVLPVPIYIYTQCSNSITNKKKSSAEHICKITNIMKRNYFYKEIGYAVWQVPILKYFGEVLFRFGLIELLKVVGLYVKKYNEIRKIRSLYVDIVIERKIKV